MQRREHQLFKRYPLNGKTPSSMGHLPTPYHIYDGYGAFIQHMQGIKFVYLRPERVA